MSGIWYLEACNKAKLNEPYFGISFHNVNNVYLFVNRFIKDVDPASREQIFNLEKEKKLLEPFYFGERTLKICYIPYIKSSTDNTFLHNFRFIIDQYKNFRESDAEAFEENRCADKRNIIMVILESYDINGKLIFCTSFSSMSVLLNYVNRNIMKVDKLVKTYAYRAECDYKIGSEILLDSKGLLKALIIPFFQTPDYTPLVNNFPEHREKTHIIDEGKLYIKAGETNSWTDDTITNGEEVIKFNKDDSKVYKYSSLIKYMKGSPVIIDPDTSLPLKQIYKYSAILGNSQRRTRKIIK